MNWDCFVVNWEDWGEKGRDWTTSNELLISELPHFHEFLWQHQVTAAVAVSVLFPGPWWMKHFYEGICVAGSSGGSCLFEQFLCTMVNTVAAEAVKGKKGEGGNWAGLTRNLSHLKQVCASRPRGHLGPRVIRTTHYVCCVPAEVFKVRFKGWQIIFCIPSVTLREG